MRTRRIAVLLAPIALLAVACGSSSSVSSGSPGTGTAPVTALAESTSSVDFKPTAPLVGPTWKLVSVTDSEAQPPTSEVTGDDQFTLEFPTDTSIQWRACNSYGGSVTVTPTTITMGEIQSTLMACEGPASQAESDMGAVLAGTVTYAIEGSTLHLTNGTRSLEFFAT